MSAAEWIAKRRELLDAATEGPWVAEYSSLHRDCVVPHDARSTREAVAQTRLLRAAGDAALIADARTSLPRALDALEAVLKETWAIESGHHFHGTTCTCGYASHRARDRTEHLTRPLTNAVESALGGES